MSDDIKKLLSIMNETTTSGSVAPVAGGMGKSMLKRPADSIFAAESVPQDAVTGLEESPKVDSPSNFGMWKNSALTGKKKNKLREGTEREQEVIDSTRSSRQGAERNAGLNEPDELPMSGKELDVGTWHFVVDGVPQKKDGKVYYSSSKKHNDVVLAHLRKKAEERGDSDVAIEVIQGSVKMDESRELPVDMDDWTDDDWAEWDEKVKRVGTKAQVQVRDRKTGEMYNPEEKFNQLKNSPEFQAQMKRMATKEGVAEGSTGVSVRKWANQVRKDHGTDVKFWNRKEGGGAVDSIVAKNSQGETVGVYNRKTGYPTVFEPKQGVAEGLSKRDQKDVDAIKAAIERLQAQLSHPNADKDAIQQSIAHEKKRLALYGQGVAEGLGKTIKRSMAGWGAFDKDKPADVVKRVKGQDTDTLKGLSNRGSTGKGSPAELQQKAISRELKKRSEQGVAEGKEDKIAQLKKDYETAIHWSKNETSPQKREAARQKAERIKRHLDTQYKTKLDEYSEWDGTGDQDLAAATAANGQEAGFADIEDKTSLSEAEITEEMIADRLKQELALMKKGSKPKDKSISKKPDDREVQPKEQKKESDEAKTKAEPKAKKSKSTK